MTDLDLMIHAVECIGRIRNGNDLTDGEAVTVIRSIGSMTPEALASIFGMLDRGEGPAEIARSLGPRSDDPDDEALRAEAARITPGNDHLRALIGRFSLPPGGSDDEEIAC